MDEGAEMDRGGAQSKIKRLEYTTDSGAGQRARIGLLVLESDQTVEWEFRALTGLPGVSVYHSRLAMDATVTPETLARMEGELPVAARLIPDFMELDAIGYGCTSGSTIIGEDRVSEILQGIHPGVPSTNPFTAARVALATMGVRRLALLTPYSPEVTEVMQARFGEIGIEVVMVGSFYEEDDRLVGRIDPASILKAAISVGETDCDGVFVSCTSLRAASIVEEAERVLGKPVTASNHALAWHLLRLAGIQDRIAGFGRLFDLSIG